MEMKEIYGKAISELAQKLTVSGIPFEVISLHDGYGICYPNQKDWKGDAVCHSGSYGHQRGLLEAMGFGINRKDNGDDVVGYLTVAEAYEYFAEQYRKDTVNANA